MDKFKHEETGLHNKDIQFNSTYEEMAENIKRLSQ